MVTTPISRNTTNGQAYLKQVWAPYFQGNAHSELDHVERAAAWEQYKNSWNHPLGPNPDLFEFDGLRACLKNGAFLELKEKKVRGQPVIESTMRFEARMHRGNEHVGNAHLTFHFELDSKLGYTNLSGMRMVGMCIDHANTLLLIDLANQHCSGLQHLGAGFQSMRTSLDSINIWD